MSYHPILQAMKSAPVAVTTVADKPPAKDRWMWRAIPPLAVGALIALTPVPQWLSVNACRYFALFASVITALITEPLPPAVLGLAGIVLAAVSKLVRPAPPDAVSWALSGFANSTVWLIFAAYVFALGYS